MTLDNWNYSTYNRTVATSFDSKGYNVKFIDMQIKSLDDVKAARNPILRATPDCL